eukprot:1156870-Pelagomonas_calceolata.AAC.3
MQQHAGTQMKMLQNQLEVPSSSTVTCCNLARASAQVTLHTTFFMLILSSTPKNFLEPPAGAAAPGQNTGGAVKKGQAASADQDSRAQA